LFLARNRGSSFHRRFNTTETCRVADESGAPADSISNLRSSNYLERDDGSESLEYTLGDSMRWMRGQAWVTNAADLWDWIAELP
jgi:hypothetical protein